MTTFAIHRASLERLRAPVRRVSPLTAVIAVADLAVAGWLVAAWSRQPRHRELYVLVVSLWAMAG